MCLLCYGRELEQHIGKVKNGKINEEFEYAQMLAADSLRLADKRRSLLIYTKVTKTELTMGSFFKESKLSKHA